MRSQNLLEDFAIRPRTRRIQPPFRFALLPLAELESQHRLPRRQILNEPPRAVFVVRRLRHHERKTARPGDRRSPERQLIRRHRRGRRDEVHRRLPVGDVLHRPFAVDLHRDLVPQKRIELSHLEALLKRLRLRVPADGVVHIGHPLQGADHWSAVHRDDGAIVVHERAARLPGVHVQPAVAVVRAKAETNQVARICRRASCSGRVSTAAAESSSHVVGGLGLPFASTIPSCRSRSLFENSSRMSPVAGMP